MPLSQLASVDIIAISIDIIALATILGIAVRKGLDHASCTEFTVKEHNLQHWRYALYGAVFSAWLAALFTFAYSNPLSLLFNVTFDGATAYTLMISVPTYICKKRGELTHCNCDKYEYADFELVLAIGIITTIVMAFASLDPASMLVLVVIMSIVLVLIYRFIPKKKIERLGYPTELLLNDVTQLQEFITSDPTKRKLITILKSSCDFCGIQVNELNQLPPDMLSQLRIFDLSYKDMIDPFLLSFTLNIDDVNKVPVPSSVIYDSGMAIEQMEGVLSSAEIKKILLHISS